MTTPIIENELSTGLVIAGAYADKLRRTLFAQLRDYVKKNREVGKEIARAAGEVNRLLYYILVEELKSDKGDVVRIRIKYSFNPETMEIKWKYDTLRVEYFKRIPDEEVAKIVEKVIKEKLAQVMEEYKRPVEEKTEAKTETIKEEWSTQQTIGIAEGTQPLEKPVLKEEREEKPVEEKTTVLEAIARADPIGATLHGGVIFKLSNEKGESMGIASIEPVAGQYYIEAVIIGEHGKAYKARIKAEADPDTYTEHPEKIVEELRKAGIVEITKEEAEQVIKAKMEELT